MRKLSYVSPKGRTRRMGPRVRLDDILRSYLLQRQRHEAQFALGVRDQQQHRFLTVLLQLIDALLDVSGIAHRLLRDLDDDLAGGKPLVGGVRIALDTGDDDALDAVLDLVAAAQVLAHVGEVEPERFLRHRFFGRLRGLDCRLHRLVVVLQPAERDALGLFLALADDDDLDLLADGGVGDDALQVLRVLDVLAVELDDDVAGLDAGRLGRTLVVDAGDQRAASRLDVEAFGDLVGDLLNPYAEPAAAQFAELPELIDHAGHDPGRHGKADTDRAAGRRDDQRVDADDFAIEIEQRATGIAPVDRRVGLDEVVVRPGGDVAVARRDDAGRHRAAQAERIADGDHPFAEPQLVGIAEFHRHQRFRRLEFQHREVGLLVDADDLRPDLAAVVEDDVDLVGVRNHVIVGHDDARGVDDEAGAERIGLVRLRIAAPRAAGSATAVLEEVVEEFLERRARRQLRRRAPALAELGLDVLRGRDVDHRVDHFLGNIGDSIGTARLRRRRSRQNGA